VLQQSDFGDGPQNFGFCTAFSIVAARSSVHSTEISKLYWCHLVELSLTVTFKWPWRPDDVCEFWVLISLVNFAEVTKQIELVLNRRLCWVMLRCIIWIPLSPADIRRVLSLTLQLTTLLCFWLCHMWRALSTVEHHCVADTKHQTLSVPILPSVWILVIYVIAG